MQKIPFYTPNIGDLERNYIDLVLQGKLDALSMLEDELIRKIGSKHAISTQNATAAMHLLLCAIDIKRGDKIICPVNIHPSFPEVIRYFDAEPIFADIREDNFIIDYESALKILENNDSKKLRALVVSYHAGVVDDWERIYELGERFDIKIIEDASSALGAKVGAKPIGANGAYATVFGFLPDQFGMVAAGGAIACEDDELASRARLIRYHAIDKGENEEHVRLEYIFDVVDIGCKYDITQLDAAFCLGHLKNLDATISMRKEIAYKYDTLLKNTPHIEIPSKNFQDHIYTNYIIKVDKNRDGLAKELLDRGISTSLHNIPMHLHSYYKHKYSFKVNDFPNALRSYQQILSLPIYSKMSEKDISYVCKQIDDLTKNRF